MSALSIQSLTNITSHRYTKPGCQVKYRVHNHLKRSKKQRLHRRRFLHIVRNRTPKAGYEQEASNEQEDGEGETTVQIITFTTILQYLQSYTVKSLET